VTKRVGLLAFAALALACTNVPTRAGGRPSTRLGKRDPMEGISVVQTKVAPQGPRAKQYGGTTEHPLNPTERAIAEAVSGMPMKHDPALSRMAREVARNSPDRVNIPPALVDGLMAWAGLPDPAPRLVVVELPDDTFGCHEKMGPTCTPAIDALVDKAHSTMPDRGAVVFGVGVARVPGGATRMIVALLERMVTLKPMPSSVALGSQVALRGRLMRGWHKPTVEVISPAGESTSTSASVSVDGSFDVTIPCTRPVGTYQVEVLAEGEFGPEVTANFPLYCGVRPPSAMTVELERLEAGVTAGQIAHANFVYLNEERERRGLAPLQWDNRAAEVALSHSEDMARNGFVGHRSPTTGDVRNRFERARLEGAVIRENVARGYGPKGIHESLMTSPGHRVNVLAQDVTHVGIGVVIGEPEANVAGAPRPIFCTQNFFKPPGAGAPPDEQLAPTVVQRVDAQRKEEGLPPLSWDPALQAKAAELAQVLAKRPRPKQGWEADLFAAGWSELETHQVRTGNFDALAGVDVFRERKLSAGIGVVRVRAGKSVEFLMVILTGKR
jgi:uncharacterized protein YkwD